MINYFYNIILKSDNSNLYSDVLTTIRKDYYLSKEKQKGRLTQNSSGDSLFYDFSIEKDKGMKWRVSNSDNIISDSKNLVDGNYCVNYYNDKGVNKVLTFSKYHTLLRVEYFNMGEHGVVGVPDCTIEPRKANNDLCLLMKARTSLQPIVLYAMPDIDDEYILDKVNAEFEDYCAVASTNAGVVKFLSQTQLELFEEFVDRALAFKLTDTAPKSFIDAQDAVLAKKLNPKDFNVKRNLSQIVDISQAQEFSYDNIESELADELLEDYIEVISEEMNIDEAEQTPVIEAIKEQAELAEIVETVDFEETADTLQVADCQNEEIIDEPIVLEDASEQEVVAFTEQAVEEETNVETVDDDIFEVENFELCTELIPDNIIESKNAKYYYFGELDDNNKRSGYGRTATVEGRTAYEGEYSDNKRNGVGAYYYKDGSLCYFGDWNNNKREGFGVGVSSFDKSVHVGTFSDNKPQGDGVRVNNNGEVRFIRKALTNGTVVELQFEGDKMIVSKFDENGEKISENSSNLIYF